MEKLDATNKDVSSSSSADADSSTKDVNAKAARRPGSAPDSAFEGKALEVSVDDRGVERAIRRLKRKIDTEGLTKEVKRRRHFEKPSVRKRRKEREAERRRRRRDRRIPGMPAPRAKAMA